MSGKEVPNGAFGKGASSSQNGKPKMSRMEAMQAQFQQKQMADKEAKLLAMIENQQQKVNGIVGKYNNNPPSPNPPTGPLQQGKVRQMFEERRKGGLSATAPVTPAKGIDKSYPLDPIEAPPLPKTRTARLSGGAPAPTTGTAAVIAASVPRRTTGGTTSPAPPLLTSVQRPSNLGSSKKPQASLPTTPTASHSMSKSVTPTQSLPPSRGSGGVNRSSASSSGSSQARSPSSNSTGYPPVSNTTKYSEYASELEKRETALSNKLKGIGIETTKKTSSQRIGETPSGSRTPASTTGGGKQSAKAPPSPAKPKGPPPPGFQECKTCGRHFGQDRITKHEAICKKVSMKKRKVFDPTKMRMQGTEAEPYLRTVSAKPKVPPKAEKGKKKADWRKQHQEFIATIRAAKDYQTHVAKGGNPADLPPPPPSDNSDYVQCPHCGRKFNEGVAERHIPKCKNIKSNKR